VRDLESKSQIITVSPGLAQYSPSSIMGDVKSLYMWHKSTSFMIKVVKMDPTTVIFCVHVFY
jgi:hypothetical protein